MSVATKDVPASVPLDKSRLVELWQDDAAQAVSNRRDGIIALTTDVGLQSFQYLLNHGLPQSTGDSVRNSLRRCYNILKLWDDGYGASEGRLDDLLEGAKDLRHTLLDLLKPLSKVVLLGKSRICCAFIATDNTVAARQFGSQAVGTKHESFDNLMNLYEERKWLLESSDTDSSNESDFDANLELVPRYPIEERRVLELISAARTYTDCLRDIGLALQMPAMDPSVDRAPAPHALQDRSAHEYHVDLVDAKFQKADRALVERLGLVSWERYLRMRQVRETNSSLTSNVTLEQPLSAIAKTVSAGSAFQDSGLGTMSSINTHDTASPASQSHEPCIAVDPTTDVTQASSTLRPTEPYSEHLAAYPETLVSFVTSKGGGDRVQVPPLPTEAKRGNAFECIACNLQVRVSTNRDWRKHLFADLRPYSCLFSSCAFSQSPFVSRQLWADHLKLEHRFGPQWESVDCPLCLETTGSGRGTILIHFARHLEYLSLVALPQEDGLEDDSQSGSQRTHSSASAIDLQSLGEPDVESVGLASAELNRHLLPGRRCTHGRSAWRCERCVHDSRLPISSLLSYPEMSLFKSAPGGLEYLLLGVELTLGIGKPLDLGEMAASGAPLTEATFQSAGLDSEPWRVNNPDEFVTYKSLPTDIPSIRVIAPVHNVTKVPTSSTAQRVSPGPSIDSFEPGKRMVGLPRLMADIESPHRSEDKFGEHFTRSDLPSKSATEQYSPATRDHNAQDQLAALESEDHDGPSTIMLQDQYTPQYPHIISLRAKFPKAEHQLLQSLDRSSWDRDQRLQIQRELNVQAGLKPKTISLLRQTLNFILDKPFWLVKETKMEYECGLCGKLIRAYKPRELRGHFLTDLRPYTCLIPDCTFTQKPFGNYGLWADHLEGAHGFGPAWTALQCPLCLLTPSGGKWAVLAHFARHLEDIALLWLLHNVGLKPDSRLDRGGQDSSGNNNSEILQEASENGSIGKADSNVETLLAPVQRSPKPNIDFGQGLYTAESEPKTEGLGDGTRASEGQTEPWPQNRTPADPEALLQHHENILGLLWDDSSPSGRMPTYPPPIWYHALPPQNPRTLSPVSSTRAVAGWGSTAGSDSTEPNEESSN